MIRPPPAGIIALVATAWVISHVPSTFSRMTVRKPFGVISLGGGEELTAGVVDEDVDPAVALEHRVHEPLDLVLLADVAHLARSMRRVRRRARRFGERLGAAAADDDPRAEARRARARWRGRSPSRRR